MRAQFITCTLLVSSFSVFGCSGSEPGPDDGEGAFATGGQPNVDGTGGGSVVGTGGSGTSSATGGTTSTATGGSSTSEPRTEIVCTSTCEDKPFEDTSCDQWKEWGHCHDDWFEGHCQETCDTCTGEEVCMEVEVDDDDDPDGTTKYTDPDATADPLPPGAQDGWASRYWDCCKPHCAWPENSPGGAMKMCSIDNQLLSDSGAKSSCDTEGGRGPAYTCWDMSPWAVSETLAYGYAATPAGGNDCGKCYQIEFTGTGQHNASDPGSQSLAGKTMIVQATNTGGDVASGQFDVLIPGGGVGMYDGCSTQWGTSDLGPTHGGFLADCNDDVNCLRDKCNDVFSDKPDLLAGCLFHVNWMGGANNPNIKYAEVECPAELEQLSGMAL